MAADEMTLDMDIDLSESKKKLHLLSIKASPFFPSYLVVQTKLG